MFLIEAPLRKQKPGGGGKKENRNLCYSVCWLMPREVGGGMPGAFAFFDSRWFCWLDFKGTTCVVKPTIASGPCMTWSFFFCLLSSPQARNGQSAAPDGGAYHHCAWVSVLVGSGGSYPSRACPSQGRHKTTESKECSQRRVGPMTTCSHHHVFVPAEGIFFC